ncbi:helix-turn-helix domain-containing protein [Rhizobacter sp. OV335]|uniref:helix-turn-helix domain-containing protein n=1 Tax=Rhizobacter sp. OV335 TaxID=1500264 RepID=UPI001F22F65E|nr:helix-turn-helix domain-containing protein [Rhizobacter sp. OV335]
MNSKSSTNARRSASQRSALPPLGETQLVLRVSVPTDRLISIIGRHVRLTPATRMALQRDLSDALQGAGAELSASTSTTGESATRPDDVLTTEQAAKLLGVSRPFVVRLIDGGAIALHQRVGNQRRVLRSNVLAWQSAERLRQAKALKRLAGDLDDEIFGAP